MTSSESEEGIHKIIMKAEVIVNPSGARESELANGTFRGKEESVQGQIIENDDDIRSLSGSTLDEIEDDEDLPVDEVVESGWSDNSIISQQMRYTLNGIPFFEPEATNFGSVRINDSSNVHLGNRTFYKGPVYVKQYIYANSTSINDNNSKPITGDHDQKVSAQPHEEAISRTEKSSQDCVSENEIHVRSTNEKDFCLLSVPLTRKIKDFFLRRRLVIILSLTATLLLLFFVKLYLLTSSSLSDNVNSTTTQDSTSVTIVPTTYSPPTTLSTTQVTVPSTEKTSTPSNDDGINIITREEWGARPPKKEPEYFGISPLQYLIISESATDSCFTKDECFAKLRRIQNVSMNLPIGNDIPYNFYVGGDGLIYEGRGWDIEGDISYSYNNKSIGISFIGNFETAYPTDAQVNSTTILIEYASTHKKIGRNFKLRGLRQINVLSQIPRENLYNIIKTWDHWDCEKEIKGDCAD